MRAPTPTVDGALIDALAAAALEALDRGGAPAPFGTWRCPAAYGKCACRSS